MDAVHGTNDHADFTLTARRGEGMALLAMNWRHGRPPPDFVGFSIQYQLPGSAKLLAVHNRLTFTPKERTDDDAHKSTVAPVQLFRWVHFPFNAELAGTYTYVVTPVFMDALEALSTGPAQTVALELAGQLSPGFDLSFTRGFVSSQAFVDYYQKSGAISTLLPGQGVDPLTFVPTHPKAADALEWMGFGARREILGLLDRAIADPTADVRVVAYDLDIPEVVERLERLGDRLRIIIDKSKDHKPATAPETVAEKRLAISAGSTHVARRDADGLQHNKFIAVRGDTARGVVFGSTNFSWRGFYVQNNHALLATEEKPVQLFFDAFDQYWTDDSAAGFGATHNTDWADLDLPGLAAQVTFSPHTEPNARLVEVARDIDGPQTECVFYSLAFLYQTEGPILEALKTVTHRPHTFVYGLSDKGVDGLDVTVGDNPRTVSPSQLQGPDVPEPFRSEPVGGSGIRMHHKFVVIDPFTDRSRVYAGSYNFSGAADTQNGENLILIKDPRVATAFAVETLRMFDHYSWRLKVSEHDEGVLAGGDPAPLLLRKPPGPGEDAWWQKHYDDPVRSRDREFFS